MIRTAATINHSKIVRYIPIIRQRVYSEYTSRNNYNTVQTSKHTYNYRSFSSTTQLLDTHPDIVRTKNTEVKTTHHNTSDLFIAISELDNYGIKLSSFPAVAVVGPQSSGKSSVIEAICGKSILPKGMGMVTMKPIHLTTIRSDKTEFKIGSRTVHDEKSARNELERLNMNSYVKKVDVVVKAPDVYNSFLIDLPGLFHVSEADKPGLKKEVKDLNIQYVEDPNIIPLIVTSATQDPATNQAIQIVRKYQRENDTFGIITKTDLVEGQSVENVEDLLNNKRYKLGHGYISVVLRNKKEEDSNLSIADKIIKETQFFNRNPNLIPSGVPNVRMSISNIQFEKIKHNIPKIIEDIDRTITELKSSESFLDGLVNDNQNRLSIRLKMLIEKLVGSSLERAEFEESLKEAFKENIGKYMEGTFDKKSFDRKFSSVNINSSIYTFHSNNRTNSDTFKTDKFKELFSYGLISPIVVNLETINETFSNESALGASLPIVKLTLDDPLGKKRLQWNKYLQRYFNNLLIDNSIQDIVYQVTENLLLEYIYSDILESDELTRRFAEYMIKEIGSEAYESKIKYSIEAMINIEKRPNIPIIEIVRHISREFPEVFEFRGGFHDIFQKDNNKLEIEVYSDIWNKAYLMAISDKLAENCYRNVAVNLLDKMVEKLLEMTIDMFNKENAIKEKTKVNNKIQKLEELRAIIVKFG